MDGEVSVSRAISRGEYVSLTVGATISGFDVGVIRTMAMQHPYGAMRMRSREVDGELLVHAEDCLTLAWFGYRSRPEEA